MIKIKTKTLSLLYHPVEDRMKLVINKDQKDQIDFWITRRFYFSLLFELDTMLEGLQVTLPPFKKKNRAKESLKKDEKYHIKKQNSKSEMETLPKQKKVKREGMLLKNINIRFSKKRKEFIFLFQSDKAEAESILQQAQFLDFYHILKSTFPKGEWGMM